MMDDTWIRVDQEETGQMASWTEAKLSLFAQGRSQWRNSVKCGYNTYGLKENNYYIGCI